MGEDREVPSVEELQARNRPPKTRPVAVRVSESLLDDLDDIWEERYDTRSEFVRTVLHHVAANPEEFVDLDVPDGDSVRPER